jgi:predicted RNase H-like HicB family nuclease
LEHVVATLTLEYWQDDGETLEELEKNIQEVYALLKMDDDLPLPKKVMTKPVKVAA